MKHANKYWFIDFVRMLNAVYTWLFCRVVKIMISWCCVLSLSMEAKDCYILTARKDPAGFFSTFNTIIAALDFIEEHGAAMIIDFGTEGFYYDPSKGPNWWSYYFERLRMDDHDLSICFYKRFKQYQQMIFTLRGQFVLPRARAHHLIEKYIRLKPFVQEKIDAFVRDNFQNYYVIGVHYRGTDKSTEAPSVAYETIHREVLSVMDTVVHMPVKIFVATDDAVFFEYMQQQFSERVCAIDALRSHDENSVHMNPFLNNYKKGEDALLDCVLLSRTHFLIKMASNLSDVSLQLNPNIPVVHLNTSYSE